MDTGRQNLNGPLLSSNPPSHESVTNRGQRNPHPVNSIKHKNYKVCLLKRSLYTLITTSLMVYLLITSACIVSLFISLSDLCSSYKNYFIMLLVANVVLLVGAGYNLFQMKSKNSKNFQAKVSTIIFLLGGLCKLGWAIWSIVIYNQNYGECYITNKHQLAAIICSFLEVFIIWGIQFSLRRNEQSIQKLSN